MPEVTSEAKKELLGTVGKLPAPLKMAMGSKVKEAEAFVKKLNRYAVLPTKYEDEIVVVSMFAGTKAPPLKVTPNFDLDDLRYIMYTIVKAYQRLNPNATAQDLFRDLFMAGDQGDEEAQKDESGEEEDKTHKNNDKHKTPKDDDTEDETNDDSEAEDEETPES
jgi:hypothetical protein